MLQLDFALLNEFIADVILDC